MHLSSWQRALFLPYVLGFCATVAKPRERVHPPLPRRVLEAKTVYLDNRSGLASLGDRAYDEMTKWGRHKIVGNPKGAPMSFCYSRPPSTIEGISPRGRLTSKEQLTISGTCKRQEPG